MAMNSLPNPIPAKRSIFNRPAWSKPQAVVTDDDFFSRSNQTYPAIAGDDEAKLKRKAARREREKGKQREGLEDNEHDRKRRRTLEISESEDEHEQSENESIDNSNAHIQKELALSGETETTTPQPAKVYPKTSSPDYQARSRIASPSLAKGQGELGAIGPVVKQTAPDRTIIYLEDSEEEDSVPPKGEPDVVSIPQRLPEMDDGLSASDEEFAELKQKVREKAQRKRLQVHPTSTTGSASLSASPQEPKSQSTPEPLAAAQTLAPDPIVSLLITSEIPNTSPLIVNRRISQRLKDVRLAWCQRQDFTPKIVDSIILTWKGQRLFNVTTCKGLGIGVDEHGNILTKGGKDVLDENDRKVHLEAMTEEMFETLRKTQDQGIKGVDASNEQASAAKETPAPLQEIQIRIILKAKGLEDFKLIVKPSTVISRILGAFRITRQIPPDKDIYFLFDGERLEPEIVIGQTDISDLDTIDVYIK